MNRQMNGHRNRLIGQVESKSVKKSQTTNKPIQMNKLIKVFVKIIIKN